MEAKKIKTLNTVLKALGILLTVGSIIAILGYAFDWWYTPRVNGSCRYLMFLLLTGVNIWLLGVICGRKHNLDELGMKQLRWYKEFLIFAVLLALVPIFIIDPVIPGTDFGLSFAVSSFFAFLIGAATNLLKRSSDS